MRWVRNNEDPNDVGCAPFVFVGFAILLLIGAGFGIYGCNRYFSNDKVVGTTITQANHFEKVMVKPEVMTCIRLEADQEQDFGLKTCDDYELVMIQKVQIAKSYGRSWRNVPGVEIYINVKRSFVLQLKYKDNTDKKEEKLLYVKIERPSKYE